MAWEPGSEDGRRRGTVLCLVLAVALATATMPATSAARDTAAEREVPVRLAGLSDVAALEPADPRSPTLQAQAPAVSEDLYSGALAERGWPIHAVLGEDLALGLVATPAGPVWVQPAEDALVPVDLGVLAEATAGPIDRERDAPEDVTQPPKAQTSSPKDGSLQIALEGDFEYYGRMIDAWDEYQLAIIHLVELVYVQATQIPFEVVDQRISKSNDQPVTGSTICDGVEDDVLDQFRLYREEESATVDSEREVAHLFTAKQFTDTTTIGCAYLSEIDTAYAYGVSQMNGPILLEDVIQDAMLVAHELGHNFDGWHFRAMPTPGGPVDVGSCASWTTIMYPCINGAKIPTFSTAGPTAGPLDALGVVEDGGNQPYMKSYGQSRT